MTARPGIVLAIALATSVGFTTAQQPTAIDRAFNEFWGAEDARGAERAAERLVKAGIDFETAYARLTAGRIYRKEKTGEFFLRFPAGPDVVFDNTIEIPSEYTPARAWPLRVQLHGGINRRTLTAIGGAVREDEAMATGAGTAPGLSRRRQPNRIPGESQIYVFPSGSTDAAWWHAKQVDNILRIVDRLQRRYNIDETRIYLTGISDGGTGAYYMAMRDPTVWSAFLPLNGSIKVLGNAAIGVDGELFAGNLVNRPFYIVNGGRDPLYPAESGRAKSSERMSGASDRWPVVISGL